MRIVCVYIYINAVHAGTETNRHSEEAVVPVPHLCAIPLCLYSKTTKTRAACPVVLSTPPVSRGLQLH